MIKLMRALNKLRFVAEISVYVGMMFIMVFSLMLLSTPPVHF
jgi:hypothetical protein